MIDIPKATKIRFARPEILNRLNSIEILPCINIFNDSSQIAARKRQCRDVAMSHRHSHYYLDYYAFACPGRCQNPLNH
jgi:hypothetical protein